MTDKWTFGRISHATIRSECVAFLGEAYPDVNVVAIEPESLRLEIDSGAGHQVYLDRVFSAVSDLDIHDRAARRTIYESFFRVLRDKIPEGLDPQTDLARLRPRIISQQTLVAMQQQVSLDLPKTPLANTGLWVVYVLDSEHSVAFVTEPMRSHLHLELDELHRLSILNLAGTFDAATFINELEVGSMVRVMTMDSYDAARVLLLPDNLPAGTRLAVAVPDRDLMMVLLAENDEAFEVIEQVAKIPSERPVFDGALEVTHEGIRLY